MFKQAMTWGVKVAITAMISSVIAIFMTGPYKVKFGDAADYSHSAREILNGNYPRESPYFPVFRPPLYPLFVSIIWIFTGVDNYIAVKIAQAILFSLSAFVLYRVGLIIFDDRLSAVLGSLVFSVNPFLILQTTDIQTEILHTFLVATGMLCIFRSVQHNVLSTRYLLAAGLIYGLASLCRPSALPIGMLLMGFVPLVCSINIKVSRRLANAFVGVFACFIPILPWAFINWRSTGEVILISDGLGYQLWLGNSSEQRKVYTDYFESREAFARYVNDYLQGTMVREKIQEWESNGGYKMLSLKQRERLWRDEAIRTICRSPTDAVQLWIIKGLSFWRPWLHPIAYPHHYVIFSAGIMIFLYLASAFGIYLLLTRQMSPSYGVSPKDSVKIIMVLCISSTTVHMIFNSMIRFRLPYVDPYFCLLAGLAASNVFRHVMRSKGVRSS